MKRLICFLLSVILMMLPTVFANAQDSVSDIQDVELLAAVNAGIIQANDLEALNEPISRADFYRLLIRSVTLNATPCESTLARMASMDDGTLTRNEAATLLYTVVLENYFGLDTSDGIYAFDCYSYAKTMDAYANRCGEAQPCMEYLQFNQGQEVDIDIWSVGYCCIQYDPYSLKTILEVDENDYFRIGDTLTREEAWKAALRLYRVYQQSAFLSLEEVEPLILSDEQIELTAQMPVAVYDDLPLWKGTALDNKTFLNGTHHTGSMYMAEDFEILHDLGFDFTRLFITHELLFDLTGGVSIVENQLANIDEAIGYAIENGVHICICLHDFPGFAGAQADDAGFFDQALLQDMTTAYAILAKRYQNVPNSILSFNLFNEPWSMNAAQEEAYVDGVHAVSAGIWAYGDRLIFVDGLAGAQEPVQSLADEPYAQSFHMYKPEQYLHSNNISHTAWYAGQQWPLPYANGVLENDECLTIEGTFPKGTQVELLVVGNFSDGNIELIADRHIVSSLPLALDETSGGKTLVLGSLDSSASELKIRWQGDSFAQIQSAAVIFPEQDEQGTPVYVNEGQTGETDHIDHRKMTVIYCDFAELDGRYRPSTLKIKANGSYTNEIQSGLTYNKDYLEKYLQPWLEFRAKTSVGIMLQEWGALDSISKQSTLNFIGDWISLLNEYQLPWNLWSDNWQYLNTNRQDVQYEEYRGYRLDRDLVDALMQP